MQLISANRPNDEILSAILNCLCPECGGIMGSGANAFRCQGQCGQDWGAIWKEAAPLGRRRCRTRDH
jgi:hypothetical protein